MKLIYREKAIPVHLSSSVVVAVLAKHIEEGVARLRVVAWQLGRLQVGRSSSPGVGCRFLVGQQQIQGGHHPSRPGPRPLAALPEEAAPAQPSAPASFHDPWRCRQHLHAMSGEGRRRGFGGKKKEDPAHNHRIYQFLPSPRRIARCGGRERRRRS